MTHGRQWYLFVLIASGFWTGALGSDALYYSCRSCHGDNGGGNEAIGAPAIAAMDSQYLARQLRHFRDGKRGATLDDLTGRQMNLIMTVLTEDSEIDALANHIQAMPAIKPLATMPAPDSRTSVLYEVCGTCHGKRGEGISAMNSPALSGLDDWYIRAQLRKFRDGVRGAANGDIPGAQMRASASNLSDQEIDELSAYIVRLGSN